MDFALRVWPKLRRGVVTEGSQELAWVCEKLKTKKQKFEKDRYWFLSKVESWATEFYRMSWYPELYTDFFPSSCCPK